jgi:DNA polymerase-1
VRIFQTATDKPDGSKTEALWVYNGLDTCVTHEILSVLLPQLDPTTRATYDFELALQAPVLDMQLRGVLVDQYARGALVESSRALQADVERHFNRLCIEGLGMEEAPNWRSPAQLVKFFYFPFGFRIAPVFARSSVGQRESPTTGRDALEKLTKHKSAGIFASHILALRDLDKKLQMLASGIDADGRMRCSYGIAGTTTGRFSSRKNCFGTGANLQNITSDLRSIFIADSGMKMAYVDLAQAESRAVGALVLLATGDATYLDACETSDLHTTVCRMTWPELPWTNDPKEDRILASEPFYRGLSNRDMAKKLGHGSSYWGRPATLAIHAHIERRVAEDFQKRYFTAFPGIKLWHLDVIRRLQTDGYLTTLLGRKRWFFGRRHDDAVIRAAIAYDPQSTVADILNRGMLQVWRASRRGGSLEGLQLLLQVHDAVLVQYPERDEDELIPELLKTLLVTVPLSNGRTLTIPPDAKVGWNWKDAGAFSGQTSGRMADDNPGGLKPYEGARTDIRKRPFDPAGSILDRRF